MILARKSKTVGLIDVLQFIMMVILLVIVLKIKSYYVAIFLGLVTLMMIYLLVDYLRYPWKAVKLDENNELLLYHKREWKKYEITGVAHKQATYKRNTFPWGSLTVTTTEGTIKYCHIDDCEKAADAMIRQLFGDPVWHLDD